MEFFALSDQEKKILLDLARESLRTSFLRMEELPSPSSSHPLLNDTRPCFVTLSTEKGHLRGCIGSLKTASPLIQNVYVFARKAAFSDPRFPAVEEKELSSLKIGISVLGPLIALGDLSQLIIGRHGLEVSHGYRAGVLLAKVAVEQKWNAEQFRQHTCLKAGLDPFQADRYHWSYFEEISFEEA